MGPRLEQLVPGTIDRLAQGAQAAGLSLDVYLMSEGAALAEMSEAEFEAFITDLPRDSEPFPLLPPDFSRADIYFDYD